MNKIQIKSFDSRVNRYALLTGATGLVGQYLMRDLLLAGQPLAIVARPKRKESAAHRVERIMQHWESELGRLLPRPVVMCGDVTQKHLGLSDADQNWIRRHCDRMIHNAAVLKFDGTDLAQEPWRTNFGGTQNAVWLAQQARIQDFHFVSTAYVCGQRQGLILESDFDCGQEFRNEYERSKFQAEKFVRQDGRFQRLTVYRPVVISGDSQTGYTSTYHGIYLYLRLFAMLVPQQQQDASGRFATRIQLPLEGNEPRNVVPVDWVSRIICEMFQNPAAHGNTYHLAPDQALTARSLIEDCYEYFDSFGVEFCGRGNRCESVDVEFANLMAENIAIYQNYETSDPTFDMSNLRQYTAQIPCPPIDRQVVHRYLDFGMRHKWGKAKPRKVNVPSHQAHLQQLTRKARELNARKIGVRIVGPGGGDWTIAGSGNQWNIEPGWLGDPAALIELRSTELESHHNQIGLPTALISDALAASESELLRPAS